MPHGAAAVAFDILSDRSADAALEASRETMSSTGLLSNPLRILAGPKMSPSVDALSAEKCARPS